MSSTAKMDKFRISYYKEPINAHQTEYFVVYGDTHMITEICVELKGMRYPFIKHAYKCVAIRGGWRIPVKNFPLFAKLLCQDETYDAYMKVE